MTVKTVARSFASKIIVCTTKVRDETFKKGKDMKIKHSVSSPPTKYSETFFSKNALHGWKNVLGKIYGGMFYTGTNDHARGEIND